MDVQENLTLESGGISRSGRVRKKSSRLAEFESSEESDVKSPKKKSLSKSVGMAQKFSKHHDSHTSDLSDSEDSNIDDRKKQEVSFQDSESESWESASNDADTKESDNYTQSKSLYFSEKKKNTSPFSGESTKLPNKSERKDKGTSRYNAYIIWAKEARADLLEQQPQMEFTAINKKLGEMWAKVPSVQKQTYNRMAKRLALQGDCQTPTSQMIRTGKIQQKVKVKQDFLRLSQSKEAKELLDNNVKTQKKITKKLTPIIQKSQIAPALPIEQNLSNLSFKVNGTTPIDVSAHLKLLGESLNNIGQKLKENEGQIAVSGSLSVLLDSMLCVLGPLSCLTEQLQETKGAIGDATLNGILDNIAYIMPGIV